MNDDCDRHDVWEALGRWRSEGRCFALLTVFETRGFTPRKAGAHMLVDAQGRTCGTVGGGAIEREALEQARALLATGAGTALIQRHLTQELGMCCGGEMAIHVEVIESAPRLLVLGAGHIGRALAACAAGAGFRVTVVDERPDWARPERFSTAEIVERPPEEFLKSVATTPRDFAVITTHDHALDQRLVEILLRRPLRFLGMIGSIPKQRKFALRLRARGFSDAEIARLHTPLGIAIGADTPEEIAISVVAELIAVRRGHTPSAGWLPPRPLARQGADPAGAHPPRSDAGTAAAAAVKEHRRMTPAAPQPEETPT